MNEKELLEISEKIGERVHELWMENRRRERGWHSPDECPNANEILDAYPPLELSTGGYCTKCHLCMKPYSQLPDSEKELDRAYPKEFLKILEEMGYKVMKVVGGYHDVDEFYREDKDEGDD